MSSVTYEEIISRLPSECIDRLVEEIIGGREYHLAKFIKLPANQEIPSNHWYFYFINDNFRRPGDTIPRMYRKCTSTNLHRKIYCLPRRGLNEHLYIMNEMTPTISSIIYSTIKELPKGSWINWTCLEMSEAKTFSGWGDITYPYVTADIFVPPMGPSQQTLSEIVTKRIISLLSQQCLANIIQLHLPDKCYDLTSFVEAGLLVDDDQLYWYLCFEDEKFIDMGITMPSGNPDDHKISYIYRLPRSGDNEIFYTPNNSITQKSTIYSTIRDPIPILKNISTHKAIEYSRSYYGWLCNRISRKEVYPLLNYKLFIPPE